MELRHGADGLSRLKLITGFTPAVLLEVETTVAEALGEISDIVDVLKAWEGAN